MLHSFLFASEKMGQQEAQRFDESPRAGSDSLKECSKRPLGKTMKVKVWLQRDPRMLEKPALQDIWQGELKAHMDLTQQRGYIGYSS